MTRTFCAVAVLTAVISATTFENLSTAELSRRAARVCAVKCESCKAVKDPLSGFVFTHVKLRLLEDIKGRSAGGLVELRIPGGEVDGIKTVVAGMPRFKTGEECIVLLGKTNKAGIPTLVAARRGVLRIARDKKGQRYLKDRVDGFASLKGKRRVDIASFRGALRAQAKSKKGASK
ncbi:MAG: hypothetical protein ACYS0E_01600 [Planctomycetota bacterium]|jgi:hypothetical protein